MILIEMGSTSTLVPQEGPAGPDGRPVTTYERMAGEQVLRLVAPDDVVPREALLDIIAAVGHHMEPDDKGILRPAWIECSNADLLTLLCTHFGLNKKQAARPKRWGVETKGGESD